MKKKQIISELIVIAVIGTTSILLLVQTSRTRTTIPIEPVTEVHIENQESSQSSVIPVEIQEVEIQNVEPVVNLFYDIPLSEEYQLEIRDIASEFGIDYELLLAIIKTESNFNADEIGDYGKSYGLMQIQPRYWTSLFVANGCSDWFSVNDNGTTGCAILQYLYGSYGDTILVLNAYNTGNPNCNNGYSGRVLDNLYEVHKVKR